RPGKIPALGIQQVNGGLECVCRNIRFVEHLHTTNAILMKMRRNNSLYPALKTIGNVLYQFPRTRIVRRSVKNNGFVSIDDNHPVAVNFPKVVGCQKGSMLINMVGQ